MVVFKNIIRWLLGIMLIGFIGFYLPDVISIIFEIRHVFIRLPMTVIFLFLCYCSALVLVLDAAYIHEDNISIHTHGAALLTCLITLITIYYVFGDLMPYLIEKLDNIPPSYIHHLTWGEIKRHPDFIPFITHIIFIFHVLIGIVFVSIIIMLSMILTVVGFLIAGNITAFIAYGTNRFFFPLPEKNKDVSQNKPSTSSVFTTENRSKSKIIREIKKTIRQKY